MSNVKDVYSRAEEREQAQRKRSLAEYFAMIWRGARGETLGDDLVDDTISRAGKTASDLRRDGQIAEAIMRDERLAEQLRHEQQNIKTLEAKRKRIFDEANAERDRVQREEIEPMADQINQARKRERLASEAADRLELLLPQHPELMAARPAAE